MRVLLELPEMTPSPSSSVHVDVVVVLCPGCHWQAEFLVAGHLCCSGTIEMAKVSRASAQIATVLMRARLSSLELLHELQV